MEWFDILAIAVGLAMDAFAVSIVAGVALEQVTGRHIFRLAWHFGLFQFLMPILGWLAGRTVSEYIVAVDHWIAFGLLGFISGKMLLDSFRDEEDQGGRGDPTRGITLVILSIATSIDALAVGLSMAFLSVSIWTPCIVIGIVAGGFTMAGLRFGSRLGRAFGRWSERLGGLVLLGLGLRILLTHLAG